MLSLSRQTAQKWSKKDKYEDGWQAKQKSQDKDFENTNSTAVTQPVVVKRTSLDNKSWMLMLLLGNVTPTTLINTMNKDLTNAKAEILLNNVAEAHISHFFFRLFGYFSKLHSFRHQHWMLLYGKLSVSQVFS